MIPTLGDGAHAVAAQPRCADLLIIDVGPGSGEPSTPADAADLILRAGRSILVVPYANAGAHFSNAVIAWTDTRKWRRTTTDALPILRDADRVTLVEANHDPSAARDGLAAFAMPRF